MDCVGKVRHGRKLGGGGGQSSQGMWGTQRRKSKRERKGKGTTKRMDRMEVT